MEKINRLPEEIKVEPGKKYKVVISDVDTDDVLYQWNSFGGVLCTVEKITRLGETVEGHHQLAVWGNPMIQFYAYDQLKRWWERMAPEILDEFVKQGYIRTNIDFSELFRRGKKHDDTH